MAPTHARAWRAALLLVVSAAGIVGVALHGPIPQDPAYHAFSDRRTLLGVPHFWNVVSNLPFALAGIVGLVVVAQRPRGMLGENALAYGLFFAGAVIVAAGSAYYHLDPTNATLVWDRLAMTIALMAFFDVVIAEHLDARFARRALLPLVGIGIASVAYWAVSERHGAPDLRPYAVVQFLPLVLVPMILLLYPSRLTGVRVHWLILACYAVAKGFELADGPVHRALGAVSGHTLKHGAAAAGVFVLAWGLRRRVPAGAGPGEPITTSPTRRRAPG
jgi:hypothetical protein